jgi:hypothetical protein
LLKLKQIVSKGLEQTASLWFPIETAYAWVHKAAIILDNDDGLDGESVKRQFRTLITSMSRWKHKAGSLEPGIVYFLKITRSYWSGLFNCYEVEGLPRTNNDLEHAFGVLRHHQRRCTGRKIAPKSLVIRGSVQLASAIATKIRTFEACDLAIVSPHAWLDIRSQLRQQKLNRVEQLRFRRSPQEFLASLEDQLLQLTLPL